MVGALVAWLTPLPDEALCKPCVTRSAPPSSFPPTTAAPPKCPTLTDGRVVSKKLDQTYQTCGRTSANPLSAERLNTKFDGCVRGIIHDANPAPLYATIQGFENLADVRAITALISASPVRAAVAA